jgi:hypothetical protein
MELIREWAGRDRIFALRFGDVLDLEQACGNGKERAAIGAIFMSVGSGRFGAGEVYHTIRLALIGGGLERLKADHLMREHFDKGPYVAHASLAMDILTALMAGIEPSDGEGGGDPKPLKFSEVSQICQTFHMSPNDLRAMRYDDFVNLIRGFNAGSKRKVEFLSDEEFADILARYEPEALENGEANE